MSCLKTKEVIIEADGRDKGRCYLLTEMPAALAEKWAAKAFLALAKAGVEVQDTHLSLGMVGLACWGLQSLAGLPYADAAELMDEMFTCVSIKPSPGANPTFHRPLAEGDIWEVATRMQLRIDIWELHVGFSLSDALLKLPSRGTTSDSSNTQTSRETSEPPSPAAKQPSTN